MPEIRGNSDAAVQAVAEALKEYEERHPKADIVVYRQNSSSIRVRVIDPDFRDTSKADRHDTVWGYLEKLAEEVQSQVSVLLLLGPGETNTSFANYEFDNPIPSRL